MKYSPLMKYIFVTGAPGSKWSSVVRNIYFSSSINQSDFSMERRYYHDASGKRQLMHLGSYFDPGMEFGSDFYILDSIEKEEAEAKFHKPFTNDVGIKIIKSHFFSYHLDHIKRTWKDPIVLVYRNSDSCIGWWVRCGHFNITYPKYDYYSDIDSMVKYIDSQNKAIKKFIEENDVLQLHNSIELARALGINHDSVNSKGEMDVYYQDYEKNDIKVYLYWPKYDGSEAFS